MHCICKSSTNFIGQKKCNVNYLLNKQFELINNLQEHEKYWQFNIHKPAVQKLSRHSSGLLKLFYEKCMCVCMCMYVLYVCMLCMFVFPHPHEQSFISQKQPVYEK